MASSHMVYIGDIVNTAMAYLGTNRVIEPGVEKASLLDTIKWNAQHKTPWQEENRLKNAQVVCVGPNVYVWPVHSDYSLTEIRNKIENVLHTMDGAKLIVSKASHHDRNIFAKLDCIGENDAVIDIPCDCNLYSNAPRPGKLEKREAAECISEILTESGHHVILRTALVPGRDDPASPIVIASKNPNLTNFIDSQFFKLHKAPESFEDLRDMSLLI